MDEDDAVAILTRRLLIEHEFFDWHGGAKTSPKLKTKGKNLHSGDPFFTTLQTLYAVNEWLLKTPTREKDNFASKEYKQFNPGEDELDALYAELSIYWDGILDALPVLRSDPTKMREHEVSDNPDPDGELVDSLLFWPIGQELLAQVARPLMNRFLPDPDNPTVEGVCECMNRLAEVNWELGSPPWRGLLLVQDPKKGTWRMRNEDRTRAVRVAVAVLRYQVGLDDLSEDGLNELQTDWDAMLIPRPDRADAVAQWRRVVSTAGKVRARS